MQGNGNNDYECTRGPATHDVPDLRPHHDWVKFMGFLLGLAVAAWGVASWAARTPSPERVEKLSVDLAEVRLNVAVMKVQMDGIRASVERIEQRQDVAPAESPKRRRASTP